jgi:hypothetical protein
LFYSVLDRVPITSNQTKKPKAADKTTTTTTKGVSEASSGAGNKEV